VRSLYIGLWAERAGRLFPAYLAYGLSIMWIGQILINVGVNVGLLPTKGLTLPFLSYGGSSLVVCCISLGIFAAYRLGAPSSATGGRQCSIIKRSTKC